MKVISASRWSKVFYFSHIFNILAGLGFALCAYFVQAAERSGLKDFDLHITRTLVAIAYVTSGISIITAITGYLTQKLPNKPSLWILYCILLSILSVATLGLCGTTLAKAGSENKAAKSILRREMQEYVNKNSEAAKRWDTLQMEHKCCGVDSYTEWHDVPYGRTTLRTPKSCCFPPDNIDDSCSLNVLPEHENADKFVYTQGCFQTVVQWLNNQIAILGFFSLAISFINITFVSLTCYLVITKKV